MEYVCKRCGASYLGGESNLIGEYVARLCIDCQNDWGDFIWDHPEFRRLQHIEVTMKSIEAMMCGDGKDRTSDLWEATQDHAYAKRDVNTIARMWVADGRQADDAPRQ